MDTTQSIGYLEWSGTYTRDYLFTDVPDRGDSFIIEIFEDAGDGAPDVDSVVRFEVGAANRTELGEFSQEFYGETALYGYHAEVDYTFEAGEQYWVSVFTELDGQEFEEQNLWEWGAGISANAESTLLNQGYDPFQNDFRRGGDPYVVHTVELDLRLR